MGKKACAGFLEKLKSFGQEVKKGVLIFGERKREREKEDGEILIEKVLKKQKEKEQRGEEEELKAKHILT